MNRRKKMILRIMAIIIGCMIFYPPVDKVYLSQLLGHTYEPILRLSPNSVINTAALSFQIIGVLIVGGLVYAASDEEK